MSDKNSPFNPFADFDISKFDFSKVLTDLKLPGIDIESLLASQRKNIEALTSANQMAVEGAQTIAKRQAEILAQSMAEVSSAARQMTEVSTPQEMTAKQAELIKQAFENTLSNLREMAEMINKSQNDVFAAISKRVSDSLDELKGLMSNK